jgi:hypothetical protein
MLWTHPIPKLFKKHPHYKHHSKKSPIIITKFGNILLLLAPFCLQAPSWMLSTIGRLVVVMHS